MAKRSKAPDSRYLYLSDCYVLVPVPISLLCPGTGTCLSVMPWYLYLSVCDILVLYLAVCYVVVPVPVCLVCPGTCTYLSVMSWYLSVCHVLVPVPVCLLCC
ncbi:hypothetical protein AVEN_272844-1 [Araneus ventricosus]|uniref:Uncharacterized protein n=1 Tax=Araneus ventricosus TaxID=182803 RepID=A0A4Y2JQ72_ARAVE|nr:hypothetical protein AVEN_272844-1 [Araneus ventricosus]